MKGTTTGDPAAAYTADVLSRVARWEDIPLGWKHEWESFVSQDTINGYCDGVEDRNPWYGPDPTEVGEPIAPPLLLSHGALAEVIRPIGLAAGNVVTMNDTHTARLCRVNTRIHYRGEVVEKFVRRGRRFRRDLVIAEDADTGEPLMRDLREFMMSADPDARAEPEPARRPPAAPQPPESAERLPSIVKDVHLVLMKTRYWGGRNPIHWDPAVAQSQGFPKPIATGQMIAAYVAEMCVAYFGAGFFDDSRLVRKYVRPVFAGDTITTDGVVRETRQVGGRTRVTADVWAQNQDGQKVIVGTVEAWRG